VAVIVVLAIMTMPVVFVFASSAVIVVIFVLAVMMAVVVANFLAVFTGVEAPFPSAMATPVGALAPTGERAVISESWIIRAIDIAAESDRTAEPRAGSEEDATGEPCGSVIAEGSAIVGRVVEVPVGADRFNADVDRDLHFGPECSGRQAEKREKAKFGEAR